jgi:DNA helicase-2/ATP-dependent DNA helicase PcrA
MLDQIIGFKEFEQTRITELEDDFELFEGLNYNQKIAASRLDGNYLVLAGPGAGKTYTLIYRVLFLLANDVDPKSICIITFTRKAAQELIKRLEYYVEGVSLGFVGTFHSLANFLKNSDDVGNLPFRLIDDEDNLTILKLIKEENNYALPSGIRANTILKIYSYSANTEKAIHDTLIDLNKENLIEYIDGLELLRKHWLIYKRDNLYMDYDDLIYMQACLVKKRVINEKSIFDYLMIDGYQSYHKLFSYFK